MNWRETVHIDPRTAQEMYTTKSIVRLFESYTASGYNNISAMSLGLIIDLIRRDAISTDCPKHGGAYDCTPFCEICQGNQETEKHGRETA